MGTTADKLNAVLASKNAIKTKFNLADDLPFSQYAENITAADGGTSAAADIVFGVVDDDKNFAEINTDLWYLTGNVLTVDNFYTLKNMPPPDDDGTLPLTFIAKEAGTKVTLTFTSTTREYISDGEGESGNMSFAYNPPEGDYYSLRTNDSIKWETENTRGSGRHGASTRQVVVTLPNIGDWVQFKGLFTAAPGEFDHCGYYRFWISSNDAIFQYGENNLGVEIVTSTDVE